MPRAHCLAGCEEVFDRLLELVLAHFPADGIPIAFAKAFNAVAYQ